jgi:ribonuclease P protein component
MAVPTTPIETIRKRADFLAIAKTGQRGVAHSVTVQARPAIAEQPFMRLGFTATKKFGNAVERNRAKRRLRHAIRAVLAEKQFAPHDLVLIAREALPDRDYKTLLEDLRYCLRKAGVQSAKP